jgi:hypothetical protein
LDGTLPTPPLPVEATSVRNPQDGRPSWDTVALLPTAVTKLVDVDGTPRRYALDADPDELRPLPLAPEESRALADAVRAFRASRAAAEAQGVDPRVREVLRELGYVE